MESVYGLQIGVVGKKPADISDDVEYVNSLLQNGTLIEIGTTNGGSVYINPNNVCSVERKDTFFNVFKTTTAETAITFEDGSEVRVLDSEEDVVRRIREARD